VTEALTLRTGDRLRLEAALDGGNASGPALVLCHPHPKMGGTMNAPLLLALSKEVVERGWSVLRFNFRGIGASEGRPSTGEEEIADARAAVEFLRARQRRVAVAIAGWSFGGAVAVRAAAEDDSLAACAAIAPAVEARPDVTAGLPPADELDLGVPLLFVCGSNDDVVSPEACRRWIAPIDHAELVSIRGANHFFWGRYDRLVGTVADWLEARV
jgi:alpha/beta superfamily hydrolase